MGARTAVNAARSSKQGVSLNEIVVFRIDLPCYPNIFANDLILEVEMLIAVDAATKNGKKYEIVDNNFAVIDRAKLLITEPVSSMLGLRPQV